MSHVRLALAPALVMALVATACAPAPALRPSLGLGTIAAQAGQAQGLLVLELGSSYALQSLADLAALRVVLKRDGAQDLVREVAAAELNAGQGRVRFEALSVGPVAVEADALDAQGARLGFARGEVGIVAGQGTTLPLRLVVGGPATQGGLGVDVAVSDAPASQVVRPLKLVAMATLPSPDPMEGAALKDLAWDRQSEDLWAAMGTHGLYLFDPTLLLRAPVGAMGAVRSVASLPQGGLWLSGDVARYENGQFLAPLVQRYFPGGGKNQQAPLIARDSGAVNWVMGATPEGQAVYWPLDASRQLQGPTWPKQLPSGASWGLASAFMVPPAGPNGRDPGLALHHIESGDKPGEVLVGDHSVGLRATEGGAGELLFRSQPMTLMEDQVSSPVAVVALAEASIGTEGFQAQLVAITPDHRGGHWAVTTHALRDANSLLMVWRRSPNGTWSRVWGPWLSAEEIALVRERVGHEPFPSTAHTGPQTWGLYEPPELGQVLMSGDPYGATATAKRGRLALSNGRALFVLAEGQAVAP